MRKLLSKQHQRQIEIIEYLKQQNDNIPISKIACAIGCSTRIIHEDFQKFKDLEKVFLISSNNAGVKLEFKKDASMEAIYYYFISESLAFRLLKVLFFQNFTNREDLCSKLFISHSALGMLIEQINLVLKENYHITIDKQQLNFTGSEKQIRLFFLRLFYDSSPKETWDFGDYCVRKTIFNYINQFYLYLTGYEDQIESFQLTTLSLINWIRYQQGYSISPTEFDSHRHIIDFLISMDNKSIQQDFSEIFHLDFSEESLLQVFFPFISDKLVYSNISNVINNNFVFTNSYIFLQKEIPHLADKLSIHLYNQQLLISKIHNGTFLFPFNVTHNSNLLESKKFRFITKQESYLPLDTKSIISFRKLFILH
ncbi:helix-turn-helix domain-containing protein [Streptococcus didelphis]|uniref:helix-turn-helix domain-containing protein n=1 Tax=Streptococcus didelphis TaxID=102886 RepID=UPI0027D262C9|nr:helix-turn-helix domain-containing protein [Streptococcus didelphis]WMB29401.1 helix-turn-helix domain-containing protein [Streptococcus didelphis]